MGSIFFEITIILCLAAFLSLIFRLLKQPAILAFILTGILIGPFGQLQLVSREVLQTMGEVGITLLLFMLGLEMRFKDFRLIGKTVLWVGIVQIVCSLILGYMLSLFFGFSQISSFYIGLALAFSSTVVIVKILSDKKDLNSLYGKISVGLLLIQDFFAILILVLLSGLKSNLTILDLESFGFVILKGLALFASVFYLSRSLFPKFLDAIAKSEETLFLFSLAWVFGLAAIVSSPQVGFSIEIGGFLAGIALANASENFQIIARMKALRDFFVTIFFVFLGMGMVFENFNSIWLPILAFSLFVILVKPLIVMIAMGLIGYRKRTSFLTALGMGQISEFSLIIFFLGKKLGHISGSIVSLVMGVAIITFIVSTYMIINGNFLYRLLKKYLWVFERKHTEKEDMGNFLEMGDLKKHVVLIGAHMMGQGILDALEELEDQVVVVDFDPGIINMLKSKGITSLFGDISDLDIQERVRLDKAKLVISTIPDLEDNLFLIKGLNKSNRLAKIIVVAQEGNDAIILYKAGADYVVLPHLSSGRHIVKILKENKLETLDTLKSKDLSLLS